MNNWITILYVIIAVIILTKIIYLIKKVDKMVKLKIVINEIMYYLNDLAENLNIRIAIYKDTNFETPGTIVNNESYHNLPFQKYVLSKNHGTMYYTLLINSNFVINHMVFESISYFEFMSTIIYLRLMMKKAKEIVEIDETCIEYRFDDDIISDEMNMVEDLYNNRDLKPNGV